MRLYFRLVFFGGLLGCQCRFNWYSINLKRFTIANEDCPHMMPGLEQLFFVDDFGNVFSGSQVNEVADSGDLVATADDGEVSDLLDHCSSSVGAPFRRAEGVTKFPCFLVEEFNNGETHGSSRCREECPLYPRGIHKKCYEKCQDRVNRATLIFTNTPPPPIQMSCKRRLHWICEPFVNENFTPTSTDHNWCKIKTKENVRCKACCLQGCG